MMFICCQQQQEQQEQPVCVLAKRFRGTRVTGTDMRHGEWGVRKVRTTSYCVYIRAISTLRTGYVRTGLSTHATAIADELAPQSRTTAPPTRGSFTGT